MAEVKGKKKSVEELANEAFEAHDHVQAVYVDEANQNWYLVDKEANKEEKEKTLKIVKRPAKA